MFEKVVDNYDETPNENKVAKFGGKHKLETVSSAVVEGMGTNGTTA